LKSASSNACHATGVGGPSVLLGRTLGLAKDREV